MLHKRDLGFPSPVFLVVVVVLPVIVFILRRKWRHSVARSEEVRRLLVSVSEEAARVEFEAREAYYYSATATPSVRVSAPAATPTPSPTYSSVPVGPPLKPQYKCPVCLCPATTRCAKCKAVRYCSGKCQIVHWRKGHKDECRPYVSVSPVNNVGPSNCKQENDKDHNEGFDTQVNQTASPAGRFPENLQHKDDLEIKFGPHQQDTTNSTSESNSLDNFETVRSADLNLVNNSVKKSTVVEDNKEHDDFTPDTFCEAENVHNSNITNGFTAEKVKDSSGQTGLGINKSNDITNLTTFSSKNTSHTKKPVKVNDNHNHKAATSSSLPTEKSQNVKSGSKPSKIKAVDPVKVKPPKLTSQDSLEGGNETTLKYIFKGQFPYETFVKLYNLKEVKLHHCGLNNCGNSCYANAVLQCLIYTPPLTAYFLEGLHSKACDKKGWCFTCEFENLVMKAKEANNSPLSPIRLLTHIENIGTNLGHGKEEDAHEFLRYVIDAMQSVCIKEAGNKVLRPLDEETTLIGLTFGGFLRSKIMCMKCGEKSERRERMMDLMVEIEGEIGTLEEALDKFTCTEILDGQNKYKCSRCKSYEKAKKKLTLLEAPNVLTIALKRFQCGNFGKLNKSVKFPEILDLAPYVSGTSDKSPIYRLFGVIVHVDTMNDAFSGHYVCYVKDLQNQWFMFDDSVVTEVDIQHVLTKEAYMLLYARWSPRAPRSIRSSLVHQKDPKTHKMAGLKNKSTEPWEGGNYHPQQVHRNIEEESSSSSDNSGFFSESCSCTTDSTQRDSTTVEDQNVYLNSSDSDTSSCSCPSPLYTRLSRLYPGGDCRKLDCSCKCCREVTNLGSLGVVKQPGLTFRRSGTIGVKK